MISHLSNMAVGELVSHLGRLVEDLDASRAETARLLALRDATIRAIVAAGVPPYRLAPVAGLVGQRVWAIAHAHDTETETETEPDGN